MTLIQAWGDSLSLLKPKNLKLFLLVTLKSIGDAYKILLKYWWWLFAIAVICYGAAFFVQEVGIVTYWWANRIAAWVYQVLLFVTLVATRPSLEQKNCAYFRRYMFHFAYVLGFLIALPYAAWPRSISPIYCFTFLFFFDSPKKIQDLPVSFVKALKMVIYNLPLLIVVGVIFDLPNYIFNYHVNISPLLIAGIPMMHMSAIYNILSVLLIPVTVCFYTNIYIKKLHDQFDLYFKQPN